MTTPSSLIGKTTPGPWKLHVYDLSDPALFDAAVRRLESTPADQWPSQELRSNILISVKLRQMELSEIDARSALGEARVSEGER